MPTAAGAVLTGGRSRRMGSDKALVEIAGRPMAGLVLDALGDAGLHPLTVVGGDVARLSDLGVEVIPDRFPGEGPLGGVVSALEHFRGVTDHVLVVACDLPDVGVGAGALRPLLDRIEARHMRASSDVVIAAADAEAVQPMCALWPTTLAPTLRAAFERGERSMFGALHELRVETVEVDPRSLRNINTPDDLGG